MKLTDIERKLLMLAMDKSAPDGEIAAAATKFIRSLRERYASGIELIEELMMGTRLSDLADILRKSHSPQQQPFDDTWGDIMRDAQKAGRAYAARRSPVEEEILRREAERRAEYRAWKQQAEYEQMMQEMGEQAHKTYDTAEAAVKAAKKADQDRRFDNIFGWRRGQDL